MYIFKTILCYDKQFLLKSLYKLKCLIVFQLLFICHYLFLSIGYRCPENYNSADFIMKILSDNNKSVNSICDEFANSKHAEMVKNAISNEVYFVSTDI